PKNLSIDLCGDYLLYDDLSVSFNTGYLIYSIVPTPNTDKNSFSGLYLKWGINHLFRHVKQQEVFHIGIYQSISYFIQKVNLSYPTFYGDYTPMLTKNGFV